MESLENCQPIWDNWLLRQRLDCTAKDGGENRNPGHRQAHCIPGSTHLVSVHSDGGPFGGDQAIPSRSRSRNSSKNQRSTRILPTTHVESAAHEG